MDYLVKETNNSFSIILPLVTNDVSYFEVIESTTLGTFSQNEQLAIILAAITNNSNALNKERLLKFDSINHLNIMIQAADINGLVIDNTELMSVFSKNKDDLINIMTHACSNNSLVLETEVFKEYSDDNKITFILAVLNGKDNNKLLKSINNENLKIIKKYFNNKDNNNEDKEKNLTLIVNNYYLEKDKEDIMKRIHACFQNIAPSMTHMDAIKLLTSDQLSYNEDILYILENILDYIRDIKK